MSIKINAKKTNAELTKVLHDHHVKVPSKATKKVLTDLVADLIANRVGKYGSTPTVRQQRATNKALKRLAGRVS